MEHHPIENRNLLSTSGMKNQIRPFLLIENPFTFQETTVAFDVYLAWIESDYIGMRRTNVGSETDTYFPCILLFGLKNGMCKECTS